MADVTTRRPSANLAFTDTVRDHVPRAIGSDGWLYGVVGDGGAAGDGSQAFRTSDSFGTVDLGHDFTGKTLYWVSRVPAGYVAIMRDTDADESELWFSASWSSGWSLVQTTRATALLAIARPVGNVLLVGEYQSVAKARELWLSKDGGQSWTSIRTATVATEAANCHWHCSLYDDGRIWASLGDGDNAWLGYTDDDGETWTQVGTTFSPHLQPTVMEKTGRDIVLSPDRNTGAGVTTMNPDGGVYQRFEHLILPSTAASQQFGNGGRAGADSDEVYIAFPDGGSGTQTVYVAATGDGGKTWHTVLTRAHGTDLWNQGIVGPDLNDKLYMYGYVSAQGTVAVADKVTWI